MKKIESFFKNFFSNSSVEVLELEISSCLWCGLVRTTDDWGFCPNCGVQHPTLTVKKEKNKKGRRSLSWGITSSHSIHETCVEHEEEMIEGFKKLLNHLPATGRLDASPHGLELFTEDNRQFHGRLASSWQGRDAEWRLCHSDYPSGDFPRAIEDYRCSICEGWGCCHCFHTGGY